MITYREKILHGDAKFPVAFYCLTPDHIRYQMAFHWHPEHEIVYVVKGELRLTLNRSEYTAKPGDMFFIQGGTFHTGVASGEAEYHCIVFDLDRMIPQGYEGKDFVKELEAAKVVVDQYIGSGETEFYRLYSRLMHLMTEKRGSRGAEFEITGIFLCFIGELIMSGKYRSMQRPTEHTMKTLSSIRNVIHRIETEYMNPLSLQELADTANMSPNYFCRFFKQITSRSPIDYLIVHRVNMAEYLLRTTDRTMTDISFSCGFNDVSHFIKYFKREKGVTPKKYRMIQKNESPSQMKLSGDPEYDDEDEN